MKKVGLLTKEKYEEYISKLSPGSKTSVSQWSKPVYICPMCGGGMRKNLWTCRSLTCNPPITEYEYRCDNEECNNIEYLKG